MGLGALFLLERVNKSEPLYMFCMFTSAACSFVYPFTTKPLGNMISRDPQSGPAAFYTGN